MKAWTGALVKPDVAPEIRPIAAANTGVRNGIPEGKCYVYDRKGRAREAEIALILARIRSIVSPDNGGGEA